MHNYHRNQEVQEQHKVKSIEKVTRDSMEIRLVVDPTEAQKM